MPPQPKRKISHHRQGRRRAAIKLNSKNLITCKSCGAKKYPHIICPKCGHYGQK